MLRRHSAMICRYEAYSACIHSDEPNYLIYSRSVQRWFAGNDTSAGLTLLQAPPVLVCS